MKVSHSYRIFQLRQLSNKYNAKRVDDSYVPRRFVFTKTGDSPTGIKVSLNDTDDVIKKLRSGYESPLTPSGVPKDLSDRLSGETLPSSQSDKINISDSNGVTSIIKDKSFLHSDHVSPGVHPTLLKQLVLNKQYNSLSPNWKKFPKTRPGVDTPKRLLERLAKEASVIGDKNLQNENKRIKLNYNGKLMDKFRFKKGQFYLSHGMKKLGEYYIKKSFNSKCVTTSRGGSNNGVTCTSNNSSVSIIDKSIPESVTKDNLLVICPTINMMANPSQNERKALNLFQFNKVYYQDHFDINDSYLNKLKAIWFFGHGVKNYDKLEIVSKNGKYNMDNFFNNNPNIHDIDFIFDVCYSSAILIDYNFMNEVNNRNIRLYTCGFNRELNTKNGSFLTFSLDLIQRLIGKNVFLLTVKQINCWFDIISDITGMKMYCYGKDDSIVNPSEKDKQIAADLLFNLIRYYLHGTGFRVTLPIYTNLSYVPNRNDLTKTVFC